MANISKQFAEWVTKWRLKIRRDEFFATRVRLTMLYTFLAVFFLILFSTVLYESLVSGLSSSAKETIGDSVVRGIVLDKASGIIRDLILVGDIIILFFVISIGFFLTKRTLKPIQSVLKKQERFIADASHELRTPLAVMKTGIDVALRQKEQTVQKLRETLSNTLEEVNILTALANDLLHISKIGFEELELKKIYLPELLEKTVKRLEIMAKERKVNLTLSGEAKEGDFIMGCESMINQVFYNLIYNAISYTPANGLVEIKYHKKFRKFFVRISDTGIGISKENLKHVFQPFYRADNSRTTSGTGLGLSIVKSHIDLHFGSIYIGSELGKGTDVVVELPLVS